MKEYDLIRRLAARLPRSADQQNELFRCDAEIVRMGDRWWGVTVDEFTPEEDLFSSDDPAALGTNLAVGTLSDLLAAGVTPRFYLHSLSLSLNLETAFADALMDGIRGVLTQAGCAFCGGDLGSAGSWRYCGVALGPVARSEPLTRVMPEAPHSLWTTGRLGDANLAALQRTPTPRFELRSLEAELIRATASCCIDTSGGFFDAVWLLHENNPELRIDLDLDRIPLAAGIEAFSRTAGIPPEAALLGGAGEYELIFAVPDEMSEDCRQRLRDKGMTMIGNVRRGARAHAGVCMWRGDRSTGVLEAPPPCPRSAASAEAHSRDVIAMAEHLFGDRQEPRGDE